MYKSTAGLSSGSIAGNGRRPSEERTLRHDTAESLQNEWVCGTSKLRRARTSVPMPLQSEPTVIEAFLNLNGIAQSASLTTQAPGLDLSLRPQAKCESNQAINQETMKSDLN